MKTVGYMEGTNPELLTKLSIQGYGTFPLSNGIDKHGKNFNILTTEDNIALVIGYFHKFMPSAPSNTLMDILSAVKVYKIPVIFIVPKEIQDKAESLIEDKDLIYKFVAPDDLSQAVFETLTG